jgi:hypothetical protein
MPEPRICRPIFVTFGVLMVAMAVYSQSPPPDQRCVCTGIDDFGYRQHFHNLPARAVPSAVGQGALAAIQEVVGLLLADPRTDWATVSIGRLRQHLLDLDSLALAAVVEERPIEGGLEITVRGDAAVRGAAERVLASHLELVDGFRGWQIASEPIGDGSLRLTVHTDDPEELPVVRALGFFGVLASGVHRPHELLAVARGRAPIPSR